MPAEKRAEKNSPLKFPQGIKRENSFFKCYFENGRPGVFFRLSKKIVKKAVLRNKMKRWMREIFRSSGCKKKVYVYLKKAPEENFQKFRESFLEVLK